MDSLSERSVQAMVQRLRQEERTVIIIAHRLSTIMNANKIVVVESGKVIEEGRHLELLAKREAYYQLWASQHGTEVREKAFEQPLSLAA